MACHIKNGITQFIQPSLINMTTHNHGLICVCNIPWSLRQNTWLNNTSVDNQEGEQWYQKKWQGIVNKCSALEFPWNYPKHYQQRCSCGVSCETSDITIHVIKYCPTSATHFTLIMKIAFPMSLQVTVHLSGQIRIIQFCNSDFCT